MADHRGLYQKYIVERTDGTPVAGCFVLEFDDPCAVPALRAYAAEAHRRGRASFSEELVRLADQLARAHGLPPRPRVAGRGEGGAA